MGGGCNSGGSGVIYRDGRCKGKQFLPFIIFHLHFSPFRDVIVLDRDNQAALKQSLEDDARRRMAVFEELDDAGLNFTGVTD